MANYEREPTSRHTRNPSYTEKPVKIHGQSRDRSSKIFSKARKVSNPETHRNQEAEFGISPNNNAGQVNRMNSNVVKLSDAYNQVVEDNIPQSPDDLNVSKRNTSVETPSRIPTPTSRRTKNLSKSSPEEFIRPGKQMNERSHDFIFLSTGDCESDGSMFHGDSSPSPATKTVSPRTGNTKRAHSLSTGAHYTGRTVQDKIETQSFKSQSDQKRKEIILSNTKVLFKGKNFRQKHPETLNKAITKTSNRNTQQTTGQKKSSPSKPPAYSRAQDKIQTFEKVFSKELPRNYSNIVNAKESIDQEINPWACSPSDDNGSKSTTSTSTSVEIFDKQDNDNRKWEDSIDITTENIMTSPRLTTVQKRLETNSNPDTNSAPKILSTSIKFSPKWTSKSPSISPSKNLSPRLDSERKEIFKYRGNAKLSDVTNSSTLEGLQSISHVDDISNVSQNAPKETHDEQTKKDVELRPNMPILDADNSLETKKKKQSASSAVTQTLADALQKYPEKFNFNSKTEKDQKSEQIIYPLDSSLIISENKIKPKDSEKLPFEPKLDVDPEERIAAEARLFEPQIADNKSEVNFISEISPTKLIPTKKGKNDETMKIDSKILPIETPKVVGAFIETPSSFSNTGINITKGSRRRALSLESQDYIQGITLNTKRTRLKDHNPSLQTHLHKGLTRSSAIPNIINTAHRITASEDLRLIKKEENIQDSDLDSLIDEIANLNENIDIDELIAKLYNDRALDPELDHGKSYLSQVKNERFFVDLIMERMKQKLDSVSHNFHDLKNSLERLEQQVASTSPLDKTTTSAECSKNKNYYNAMPIFSIISSWLYTRVPSSKPTRLFRDRNWRFTWLGLMLLIFLHWYVAELAMCAVFCHPKYSNKNTWQPSDPFFPWAIPTKLDQWTGRFISGGIGTILDWFHYPTPTHHWPTHLYSGYDWWEGRSGPSMSFHFGAANADFSAGNINDDELLK